MSRFLSAVAICLVLALGPVAPYVHLAMVPHHYCTEHRAFEEERGADLPHHHSGTPSHPGDPEHDHERCLIVDQALQPANRPATNTATELPLPLQRATVLVSRPTRPLHRDTVRLAPKTSPPDSPPTTQPTMSL